MVRAAAVALAVTASMACNASSIAQLDGVCDDTIACAAGLVCGYPMNAGCVTQGICVQAVASSASECSPTTVSCGCDGGRVTYGCDFPAGYAPAPIASALALGACPPGDAGDGQ